jgi:predicted metal-binding membrane protein
LAGDPAASVWIDKSERRARLIAALFFLVCAAITVRGALRMGGGMSMPGGWTMPMMWMAMPGQTAWSAAWIFLLMWLAMMVAMMLPSAWPMLSLYRRVAISSGVKSVPLGIFLVGAGYFAVWLLFGAAGFSAGFGISRAAMASARISRVVPLAAGLALISAGLFQLSPLKQACLKHCRSPLLFLAHAWRPGIAGALRVGIVHGAYCAACCWALMLIQMTLGVMNLTVMVVIAAAIAIEKLWKRGPLFARIVGIASIALGIAQLVASLTRFQFHS